MADAVFTARAATPDLVKESIKKLSLPKNSNNQYNHDGATNFRTSCLRVLKGTYNPTDPSCGMSGLASKMSKLSKITTTTIATVKSILDDTKAVARAESAATGTTIAPSMTEQSDAQEEADRINLLNQAVIGAKEGFVKAVTNKVGTDITDSVLKTADGSDYKEVDDYQLEDLLDAVLQGADCPSMTEVLKLVGLPTPPSNVPVAAAEVCVHGG
jgi:hypothetical protein